MEPTHRLASLADDSPRRGRRHLDVGLQLDLLLWPEEILFLQFAVDSALSLDEKDRQTDRQMGVNSPLGIISCRLVTKKKHVAHEHKWQLLVCAHLKLSLGGSGHDHHPHFGVWRLGRSNLTDREKDGGVR